MPQIIIEAPEAHSEDMLHQAIVKKKAELDALRTLYLCNKEEASIPAGDIMGRLGCKRRLLRAINLLTGPDSYAVKCAAYHTPLEKMLLAPLKQLYKVIASKKDPNKNQGDYIAHWVAIVKESTRELSKYLSEKPKNAEGSSSRLIALKNMMMRRGKLEGENSPELNRGMANTFKEVYDLLAPNNLMSFAKSTFARTKLEDIPHVEKVLMDLCNLLDEAENIDQYKDGQGGEGAFAKQMNKIAEHAKNFHQSYLGLKAHLSQDDKLLAELNK